MTRGSDTKPTRRLLESTWGELVVELRGSTIVMRTKGSRSGGPAEVSIRAGSIYQRAIEQKLVEQRRAKQKARKQARKERRRVA